MLSFTSNNNDQTIQQIITLKKHSKNAFWSRPPMGSVGPFGRGITTVTSIREVQFPKRTYIILHE